MQGLFKLGTAFLKRNIVGIGSVRHINMAGASLAEVVEKLMEFAPTSLSEKWDNTGLLIEPFTPNRINKILLTNDLTLDVMAEAVDTDVQLIISYHPPIFSSLKSVTQRTWKEQIVSACLEKRIAVYSPHTSWDSVDGGVNDWLAAGLPKHQIQPITEGPLPNTGVGRLCQFEKPQTLEQVISSVKKHIGIPSVRLALARGATENQTDITTVALCAGSGSSVLRGVKADLYLTGEMLHHDILDAVHNGTSVILTDHSNSERGFLNTFDSKLEEMLESRVTVTVSRADKDPLTNA